MGRHLHWRLKQEGEVLDEDYLAWSRKDQDLRLARLLRDEK